MFSGVQVGRLQRTFEMSRYLKTACKNCPYRLGSNLSKTLSEEHKNEFWDSHIKNQELFYCHETCKVSEDGDEYVPRSPNERGKVSKLCYGAMATQWKAQGGFNWPLAFEAQEGKFVPEKMDTYEYPKSLDEWKEDTL